MQEEERIIEEIEIERSTLFEEGQQRIQEGKAFSIVVSSDSKYRNSAKRVVASLLGEVRPSMMFWGFFDAFRVGDVASLWVQAKRKANYEVAVSEGDAGLLITFRPPTKSTRP